LCISDFHRAAAFLYSGVLGGLVDATVALVCNGLLLLSAPIDGGHYFIDILLASHWNLPIWIVQKLSQALGARLYTARNRFRGQSS